MVTTAAELAPHLDDYWRKLGVTIRHPSNHHLVCPLPSAEVVAQYLNGPGQAALERDLELREELLAKMDFDPMEYGFKPAVWNDVAQSLGPGREVLVMGGNRSSKTEFAAWYSVRDMITHPNRIWGALHSSEESSIRLQQPRIFRYLPPKDRYPRKDEKTYLHYKEVTGFTNRTIILENGSRMFFFNYKQDPGVLEGYEFDGVWADELIPRPFEDAVRYRLVTRRGCLIETFTPIQGYSLTVAGWMAGAWVVRSMPSPLLPGRNVRGCPEGHMPYEMQCVNRGRKIFFFATTATPYGDPENDMVAKLEGATTTEIKVRAYGYPDKQIGNAFPKFNRAVHVIARNPAHPWHGVGLVPPHPWTGSGELEPLYPKIPPQGSNYVVIDPAYNKNFFIKWYHTTPEGWTIVYREWPPLSTHGEWALPADKADGKVGPAQRFDYGQGITAYKRLILEAQGATWTGDQWDTSGMEEIADYYMDARLGGTEVPSADEPTSIIQEFEEEQFDEEGRLVGPSLAFLPAPGGRVLEGLMLLCDRFDYDQDQPLSSLNAPRWYVVDACEQSIYAYEEYTGVDGEKGALKDVIDPDRYFVNADLEHVGELELTIRNPNLEEVR